jgi:rare lipoprotein A (peptidoglycan hydrolase)
MRTRQEARMRLRLVIAAIAAATMFVPTAQAHWAARCSSSMTPAAQLKCGKINVRSANSTLRFWKHHWAPQKARDVRDHLWLRGYGKRHIALAKKRMLPASLYGPVTATWYGPGFYGQGTACGHILTTGSMWVASMSLPCGTPVWVCKGKTRCYHSWVDDTGAFSATFDLAPGLARWLGGYYTHQDIYYRVG